MTARMVETVRKGSLEGRCRDAREAADRVVESVNAHGASGVRVHDRQRPVVEYVLEQARAAGVPVPALEGFQRTLERAMGGAVQTKAREVSAFITRNEGLRTPDAQAARRQASSGAQYRCGRRPRAGRSRSRGSSCSSEANRHAPTPPAAASSQGFDAPRNALWISLPLLPCW